jgi:cytochrome d ubiquinol oxidase subunit I
MLQGPVGHWHSVQVAETQPEKMASFEALFETQTRAPYLIFGIPDPETGQVRAAVEVPGLLSLLISGNPDTEVKGLNDYPRDEWPPVKTAFWTYHLMILLGLYFIALTGLGVILLWRKKLFGNKFFMKIAFFSLPLPIITNELGWIAAEVGRQPWIVYRVDGMRTAQAVSSTVSAGEILASIIMFGLIYTLLFFLWVHLLRKQVGKGPDKALVHMASGEEVVS